MKRWKFSALVTCHRAMLVLLGSALLCAVSAAQAQRTTEQRIIGGTIDSGDPAVVALHANGQFVCTGTLISSTEVLTAAHCVTSTAAKSIITGYNLGDPHPEIRVTQVRSDPAYDENDGNNGHDIAIVVLETPITTITPIPTALYHPTTITDAQEGTPVRLVGYGVDSAQPPASYGIRRQVTTTLVDVGPHMLQTGTIGHSGCFGDSGGPVLMQINGVEHVVGVIATGDATCSFVDATRVDNFARLVKQMYLDFLNRSAESGGLTSYVDAMARSSSTQAAIATALKASDESRGFFVKQAFQKFLFRAPDPTALAYYRAIPEAAMESELTGSLEYFQKHGNSNPTYVTALFNDLLARPPEQSAKDYYVGLLARGESRAAIAAAIVGSTEHRARQIDVAYQRMLERAPDATGRNYYLAAMANGTKIEDIRAALASSLEYYNRAHSKG